MDGRRLVGVLLAGTVVVAIGFWWVGLRVRDNVTLEASAHHLPELSREEVAVRVAQEDMFGLPSRLPDAPQRNIARAFTEATAAHPLPATAEGVAALVSLYAVTVKGCRGMLPPAAREAGEISVWVTLRAVDGFGHVSAVDPFDGIGAGQTLVPFTHCVQGGMQPAFFEAPEGGERTLLARLPIPK